MRCPNCNSENPEAIKFCGNCGEPLKNRCPSCGTENPPQFKFCGECGKALQSAPGPPALTAARKTASTPFLLAEQPSVGAVDMPEGERKTVTALFADIKGSMELMEDLDPEQARAIIDPALKLMIDAVHRYGGYIVQSTGDSIFALFGAPVAYEDHSQRAVYAALRMQEEMRRYAERLRADKGLNMQVRVGVNTGEVVVRSLQTDGGHAEYTPIGHSTGLAARLQTLANPGAVVISQHVAKLVEGYFQLKSLGPARIKGVSDPVAVWEVVGLGPLRTRLQAAARRGLTRFVGRETELAQMRHALQLSREGHGQVVAAIGEAGVGKSRLFLEFKAPAEGGAKRASPAGRDACPTNCMVLEAYSVSHGKASAYLPVIELLREYFEISSDDDDRKRRERILGKVLGLDRTLEDTLPYLYSLHGIAEAGDSLVQMDPQIRRRRTLEAIKRILLRESLNQPLIVVFEDLHWIDGETQALLNLLIDAIANARVLLLVNYRPEWGSRTHYTQLRLDPLGRESAEEMLNALLGTSPVSSSSIPLPDQGEGGERDNARRVRVADDLGPLKRLIIERTEGTPFFMEEMVQALIEEGVLRRNGMVKLARPMRAVKIPATVQAVLASRIDRLSAPEKELLQTLGVLGREFALNLVQRVTLKSGDELGRMLAQLQLGEFIFEQPTAGEIEYIFKHALTQEVAYNSILAERRRALHGRTAHAIEGLYADQLDDHYGDLARHFLRSNDAAKAIHYAQLAAEQALNRAAYPQAMSLIEAALKLLEKLPEGAERNRIELALRSIESTVAFVLHGASSKERERAVRRMCELAESIGQGDQFVRALSALSALHYTQGESARGLELARRCLALGDAIQDEGLFMDLRYNAGMLAWRCGELREAALHFEDALRQAHRTHCRVSPQWGILYASVLPSQLALPLQSLGRVSEAVKVAEEGLRHARDSRHMFSLGYALIIGGGQLFLDRRQPDIARAHCEEAIALSEENGFAEWLPWGRFINGWALFDFGQVIEGLAEMDAGITGFRRLGGVPRLQYLIAVRAGAIARIGRVDEALTILNETLAYIGRSGDNAEHAEMLRLKGEVVLMHDRSASAEAEKCFREALEVARRQEAKWWELRATVSLARVLGDIDRRDEARAILAKIYNWFKEGFDLLDLKEAKALLEKLGAQPS